MASKQPVNTAPDNMENILYVKQQNEQSSAQYRGYKRDYLVRDLDEFEKGILICRVCQGIMRKASIVREETTCQLCSENPRELHNVRLVENSVKRVEIKCPLLKDCLWKGKLSEAETHLNCCEQFMISCTECEEVVKRANMKTHKLNSCEMRDLECKYCKNIRKAKDYKKHSKYCLDFPVKCPNNCEKKLFRKELQAHNAECPLTEIECTYAKYGCKVKPLRKLLLAHKKENIVEHMDMVVAENRVLESKLEDLESDLRSTKQQLRWKLFGIQLKQNRVKFIESHAFYVNNYKLKCICRIHNFQESNSSSYSTNLQFSIKRIKGEFDGNLGLDTITNAQILFESDDGIQSKSSDKQVNYPLKIENLSDTFFEIECKDFSEFLNSDDSLLVQMRFKVNSKRQITTLEGETLNIQDLDPFRRK